MSGMLDSRFSIPLGAIKGIPLRLHLSFFILLIPQVLLSGIANWWWALYYFILMGPLLLITVLIHELGHSLAARSVEGQAYGILLWPLGGLAYCDHDAGPKADIWVAFAGPLTHVPMIIFWVLMMLPAQYLTYGNLQISLQVPFPEPSQLVLALVTGCVVMNIALLMFNLLVPAYPLDGGRIFANSLLLCGVSAELAAKVTVGVAGALAIAIIVFGFVRFAIVTIMVGFFILWSDWLLLQCIMRGQVRQHPLFAHAHDGAANGSERPGKQMDSTAFAQRI